MAKSVGLTLGKFAPLHKGHQLLIETALSEVDHLIVVIYDAFETTFVPLNVRSQWIRDLYPQVQVVEAWDGPTEVGESPEIQSKQEDYLLHNLKLTGITHFYSSEFYGKATARALGAQNRLVDPQRNNLPISGTKIRETPYELRHFISARVYKDLITNVVFLGGPSTGKTTMAMQMAETMSTVWMPEYGREYWENNQVNRRLSLEQLVEIAEGHLKREDDLLYNANRYIFTDTNALTTYLFSLYYHGKAKSRLCELADQASRRYDLVFVCDTDIPYDDTWDRSGDGNRIVLQKQTLASLQSRKIPYFLLSGTIEQRIRRVQGVLSKFHKYQNLMEIQDL